LNNFDGIDSKSESIYEKIRKLKRIDGSNGWNELNYLYMMEAIPIADQIISANVLCGKFITCHEENSTNISFDFKEYPIITFVNVFINKINILVQEEVIEKLWLENLTRYYIFNSTYPDEVKIALILAEKYLDQNELKEAVDVFTKSGEYIYYLTRAIKNLNKCNSFLMELIKNAKGSVKVFAVTNIEILSEEINNYLFEEGYKDKLYEEILIEFILTSGNIKAYLNSIQGNVAKINNFSKLIYKYLKKYKLKDSPLRDILVYYYVRIAMGGSSYVTLVNITTIWQELVEVKEFASIRDKYYENISENLKRKKWSRAFIDESDKAKYEAKDIITVSNYYDFKLSFEDLKRFLEKRNSDFHVYLYLTIMGSVEDKLQLLQFFYETMDMDRLISGAENIPNDKVLDEHKDWILLSLLIRGCRNIYPEGKELAIKGLCGKINEVRNEAIKTLRKYKHDLCTNERVIIRGAFEKEPNIELKNLMKDLCKDYKEGIIEYVNTKSLKVMIHVKDIYLLQTNVSGSEFRSKVYLEKELKKSRLFYLQVENDNSYDKNAIRIIGESGYVIGYVPRKDTVILANLLRGERYLYCLVKEYSLEKNYIRIRIYLSYKNVIKEAETLFKMMACDGGYFEN